jgi:hypothetical protein
MNRPTAAAGAAVIGGVAAYLLVVRPWQLRWGATDEERDASLDLDDLIPNPDLMATRAITVHAAAEHVWPWIAQLGQGRGGFYSYDALENLVGCDIHSADQIVPQWQDVKVGDQIKLAPRLGWALALWSRAERWCCAVACRWAQRRPPTTAPGPLSCGSSRTGRPCCWCATDTRTPAAGWVPRRAGCGGRLCDESTDALRDQGSCRTGWPPDGLKRAAGSG